jgi:hypothetical protein
VLTRANVVQSFLNLFEEPRYLEVGVNRGATFHAVKATRKVAVDPTFLFPPEERETASATEYWEIISDCYFEKAARDGAAFDVVFIDGLHTFEQTLRDFLNASLLLQPRGVIIVDDVIPNSYDASLPDFSEVLRLRELAGNLGALWSTDGSWMGDVFRLPFFIEQFLQSYSFATVSENHGQTVVWRQVRSAKDLPQPSFEAISRLDFRATILSRSSFRLQPLEHIIEDVCLALGHRNRTGTDEVTKPKISQFPDGSILSSRLVPGEQMPRPRLSYPELMPQPVRDVLSNTWGSYRPEKEIKFHLLEEVFVVGDGLVFDRNLALYGPTTTNFIDWQIAEAFETLRTGIKQANVKRYESALLCGQAGLSNYGHWLIEMLPIAFLARDCVLSHGWDLFVPHIYPWMAAVVRDSLSRLKIEAERVFENDGRPIWFRKLLVVTGITQHGKYYLPVTAECLQEIASDVEPDGSESIWVSRLGENRALAQEEEVNRLLSARGWRVIFPGKMSLREQIAACKGARHLAGVDGAGLTNIGFMPSGGNVTAFTPANMPDLFFWGLAANRKLSFHEVRCPITPPTDTATPWDGKLLIDPEEVLQILS